MDVSLPPHLEELVEQKVDSGRYTCASEVVVEALWLLDTRDRLREIKLEELRKEIAIGLDQADRGQLIPAEEVFERLRKRNERFTQKAE
jgi:antitoxin ParD1/3/4